MELTPTLILNLALLIVPPVVLVLVFRQWLARHIRWTVALTASVMFSCFGMNCSTMRVSVCLLCCFWYSWQPLAQQRSAFTANKESKIQPHYYSGKYPGTD